MNECAEGYAAFVLELIEEAKRTCKDPLVLIEQRLDFSEYVKSGFGTGDCVIVTDGTLHAIDYSTAKVFGCSAILDLLHIVRIICYNNIILGGHKNVSKV